MGAQEGFIKYKWPTIKSNFNFQKPNGTDHFEIISKAEYQNDSLILIIPEIIGNKIWVTLIRLISKNEL